MEDFQEVRSLSSWFIEYQGFLLGMTRKPGLQVALDGSYDNGFLAYAGVAGTQRAWMDLDEKWQELLDRFGLEYLRMAEAMNWGGQFARKHEEWASDRHQLRQRCLGEFAHAAKQFSFRATGFAVEVGGQADSLKTAEAKKRDLFQRVVLDLLANGPPNCQYMLACDQEDDMADNARKWLANLRQANPEAARVFGLCFVSAKIITQIQLADMVAYVLREDLARQARRPTDKSDALYVALTEPSTVACGLILNGHIVTTNMQSLRRSNKHDS